MGRYEYKHTLSDQSYVTVELKDGTTPLLWDTCLEVLQSLDHFIWTWEARGWVPTFEFNHVGLGFQPSERNSGRFVFHPPPSGDPFTA